MVQVLKFSDKFKINMLRNVIQRKIKYNNIGIISKEMETLKTSHKKVLEIKNCNKNEKFLWVHQ